MARDCIFYSEGSDMGATIPFCDFEDSSNWNCCKYFKLKGSTQELCPHYISRKDGLEILRKFFTEEAEAHRRMTNREKWAPLIDDGILEDAICREFVTPTMGEACPGCPLGSLCRSYVKEEGTFEQYMAAVSKWLDEEVQE